MKWLKNTPWEAVTLGICLRRWRELNLKLTAELQLSHLTLVGSSPLRHSEMHFQAYFLISGCPLNPTVSAWLPEFPSRYPVQLSERKWQRSWEMELISLRTHFLKLPMIIMLTLFTFLTLSKARGREHIFIPVKKGWGDHVYLALLENTV